MLEIEPTHLSQIKFSLQKKQAELESLYQEREAARKIETIAERVLRRNLRFVWQLEEMERRDKQIKERIGHAADQLDVLKIRLDRDTHSTRYKVVTANAAKTNDSLASLIADAILFEPQAIQLVARFGDNNLETEKD